MRDSRLLIAVVMTMTLIFVKVTLAKDCGSLEIRDFRDLESLTNCTVILGNLALVFPVLEFVINYKPEEINAMKFPLR